LQASKKKAKVSRSDDPLQAKKKQLHFWDGKKETCGLKKGPSNFEKYFMRVRRAAGGKGKKKGETIVGREQQKPNELPRLLFIEKKERKCAGTPKSQKKKTVNEEKDTHTDKVKAHEKVLEAGQIRMPPTN